MAMGSTGTVNITPEMMRNALTVIEEYQTKTNNLHTQLTETVDTLVSTNFSGNAADGFKFFYDDKIVPAVGEGLTKLITALHDIVQGTLEAIPDSEGLDDQLADGNRK
ncbi:MAG TPA: WXG100 family type VII secretion target [Clostridiales bacterium]|nr:WXG100 family type VII secretion target [Clostridiales bacterium]